MLCWREPIKAIAAVMGLPWGDINYLNLPSPEYATSMLAWELWTIIIYISRSPKQCESDVRVYDGDGNACVMKMKVMNVE